MKSHIQNVLFFSSNFKILLSVLIDFCAANRTVATLAGLTGKSFNCAAFYLVYIHTAEIFPTVTRNIFVSFGSTAGRIGTILAPYFAYLGKNVGPCKKII